MSSRLAAAAVVLLLATTGAAHAAGNEPKPPSCAHDMALAQAAITAGLSDGTEILAFDHATAAWSICKRSGNALASSEMKVDRQLDNMPRLLLGKASKFAVFLVNTNPVLYLVKVGDSKEAAGSAVADLQRLIALLGSVGAAAVEVAGTGAVAPSFVSSLSVNDQVRVKALTDTQRVVAIGTAPSRVLDVFEDALKAAGTMPLTAAMKSLKSAAGGVQEVLAGLADAEADLRSWTQNLEWAGERGWDPMVIAADNRDPHEAFEELRDALDLEESFGLQCKQELVTLDLLLSMRLCPGSKASPPCGGSLYQFGALADRLLSGTSPEKVCASELRKEIKGVAREVVAIGPTGTLTVGQALFLERAALLVSEALALGKSAADMVEKSEQAAAGEATAQKSASFLASVRKRYESVCPSARNCQFSVLEVDRRLGHDLDLDWSKVRTEKFTVAQNPLLKDVSTLRSTDAKFEYELARAETERHRFSLDYALLHTEAFDQTFSAVSANPNDPNSKEKVIGVKSRDTRAGEPALFLTWARFGDEHFSTGPQIGAAVDSAKPALYLGWSFRWRFVGVGAGWGFHRLTQLDGQKVGDAVLSTDDIRTRKRFESDSDSWYVALTLSLTDLPFFKPKS